MSIYFQHVGERGGLRDFPKTIGTLAEGVRLFQLADFPEMQSEFEDRLTSVIEHEYPNGFQVWGIPSGARGALKNLRVGDWLLLLMADGPGGEFYYGGKVIFRPKREQFEVSLRLWGEARFPLVVFLDGTLTNFPWEQFRSSFGYKSNWRLAGNTYRLTEARISESPYATEEDVVRAVLGITAQASEAPRPFTDLLDQVELMLSLEGQRSLREHLVKERDPALIRAFKKKLKDMRCAVCSFDFEKAYGAIGRGFIEAHHIDPIGERTSPSLTSVRDFLPVCSNCHRMLHRRCPPFAEHELVHAMTEALSRGND
jgi:hypothetical protein